MSYRVMYGISIGVAVLGAMLVAVQASGAQALGLSSTAFNWLPILNAGLIVLAGVLPSVRKPPSDDRVGMD